MRQIGDGLSSASLPWRYSLCHTTARSTGFCFKGGGPLLREFLGGGSGSALALTGWQGFNSPVFF